MARGGTAEPRFNIREVARHARSNNHILQCILVRKKQSFSGGLFRSGFPRSSTSSCSLELFFHASILEMHLFSRDGS